MCHLCVISVSFVYRLRVVFCRLCRLLSSPCCHVSSCVFSVSSPCRLVSHCVFSSVTFRWWSLGEQKIRWVWRSRPDSMWSLDLHGRTSSPSVRGWHHRSGLHHHHHTAESSCGSWLSILIPHCIVSVSLINWSFIDWLTKHWLSFRTFLTF